MSTPLTIELKPILRENVDILRRLNAVCFPIVYNDAFYRDIVLRKDDGLTKFAYYGGSAVGAVCARLEDKNVLEQGQKEERIYIMTLCVLAGYRGRQIGTQLIQSLIDNFEENKDDKFRNVVEIALHVQISNKDAIRFYRDRFGFEQGEMVENYYRRIDPPHCYLLYKNLRPNECFP
jgi:N-alpha-acetyltransferase 50